ncbi:MAG TPA: TauD/TfdA family dioxygenase, partial [Alcaligenes sp.]|nr:TauD/TfdA family dioxygenase [Alcaligenes sp.]
ALDPKLLEKLLFEHKILVFRGFSPSPDEEYLGFCKKFGDLMHWEFGPLLNVRMEQDPKNHIFSKGRVELHWDGAFANQTPRINAFQCVRSSIDGVGGETLFVDTSKIIANAEKEDLENWSEIRLNYSTEKKAHYGGDVEVCFIENHPHSQHKIIRFIEINNEDNLDVNPVRFDVSGLNSKFTNKEDFFNKITDKLYSPQYMYRHRWQAGDYMLIDNNSVLHGRAKVEGNASRHLKRVHIL